MESARCNVWGLLASPKPSLCITCQRQRVDYWSAYQSIRIRVCARVNTFDLGQCVLTIGHQWHVSPIAYIILMCSSRGNHFSSFHFSVTFVQFGLSIVVPLSIFHFGEHTRRAPCFSISIFYFGYLSFPVCHSASDVRFSYHRRIRAVGRMAVIQPSM